jgi:hypothetical protein
VIIFAAEIININNSHGMKILLSVRIPLLLMACTVVFGFQAQAQNNSISGKVIDDAGEPIFLGNVLALSVIDSSLIQGTVFMDGVFLLPKINAKSCLLKLTSLGYTEHLQMVEFSGSSDEKDLGTITLGQNTLAEVEIVAIKPMFESMPGMVKINVENTMLSTSTTTAELLSKTPDVVVTDNGLSVFGKGEAIIYLKGQQITFERLQAIPVSQIESVEVISNPSAKYDAEGKAVVNIILKKNELEGWQGTAVQSFTKARYFLSTSSLNLNYRKKKFSLLADYGITAGDTWTSRKQARTATIDQDVHSSVQDATEDSQLKNVSNWRLGTSYDINDVSSVSLTYDGSYSMYNLDITADNEILFNGAAVQRLNIYNDASTVYKNNAFTVNYQLTTDTLGSSLFAGGAYTDFSNGIEDMIDEQQFNPQNDLTARNLRRNVGESQITIATGQIDYSKNTAGGNSWELGAKYTDVSTSGMVTFHSQAYGNEEWVYQPLLSNNFQYSEQLSAAYTQFAGASKKWSYGAGVRAELTEANGYSVVFDQSIIDSTYLNFFPSARISHKGEKVAWGFSYASSIKRPTYQDLDPFVFYQDSLTSVTGNPFLVPEYGNAVDGSITWKGLTIKSGYLHAQNSFRYRLVPGTSGPNSFVMKLDNVDLLERVYTSLVIPVGKGNFYTYTVLSVRQDLAHDDEFETNKESVKPRFYGYSYCEYIINKVGTFEMTAEYQSAYGDGIYTYNDQYSLTIGMSRTFLNDKLTTRITANDILRTYRSGGYYKVGLMDSEYEHRLDTYFFRFSLVYNFGKLKAAGYKGKSVNDDETGRIKQ